MAQDTLQQQAAAAPPVEAPTWLEALKLGIEVVPQPSVLDALKAQRPPTAGEYGLSAVQGFRRGVGGTVASGFDAADALARGAVQGVTGRDVDPNYRPLGEIGDALRAGLPETPEAVARYQPEGLAGKAAKYATTTLPEAVGSTVALGAAGGIGGTPGVAIAGALAGGGQAYREAEERHADDSTKWTAFGFGLGLGASEALPFAGLAARIDKRSGGVFSRIALGMAEQGLQEGAQEGLQAAAAEVINANLYDEDKPLLERLRSVAENAGTGALVGALFGAGGAATSGASAVRGESEQQQPSRGQEVGFAEADPASRPLEPRAVAPSRTTLLEQPIAAQNEPTKAQSLPTPEPMTLLESLRAHVAEMEAEQSAAQPELAVQPEASPQVDQQTTPATVPEVVGIAGLPAEQNAQAPQSGELPAAPPSGDAAPISQAPSEEPTTSIKNKIVDRELADMGLPPAQHGESVKDVERHGNAMETLKADPLAGKRLVDELEGSQRPPTGDEGALLALEVNRLIVERDAAQEAFNADPSEENQQRIDKAVADYARTADVVTIAGTESSASLRIRKMMIARDYSLAAMERAVQVAKGGEPLTLEESARVKELHDQLAAANLAHETYVTQAELKQAELEAENALLRMKREVKRAPRVAKREQAIAQSKAKIDDLFAQIVAHSSRARSGLDVDTLSLVTQLAAEHIKIGYHQFSAWADEVSARIGEHIKPYLQEAWTAASSARVRELSEPLGARLQSGKTVQQLGGDVRKIAEQFVAQGVTDREQLVDKVHEVLKEIEPGITRRETMDAISGYGDYKQLSKDEVKAKLRDLKGQLQQVAKIEDLESRIPPSKTGVERRTPSNEERRLVKQVNELKRKLGIRRTDPETQLRSALDARKTWLTHRIADLEQQITENDFAPRPKPKPLELDSEAIRLRTEYEQTRRRFEREKERHRLRNRTKMQKAVDAAKEALALPKALMTAWDFSAVLRQGAFFSLGHPVETAKQLPATIKAAFSEKSALRTDVALRNRPLAEFGNASKLELTRHGDDIGPHEEAIRSAWSDKIPGIKGSNRAFITFLNMQRAVMFDAMVRGIPGTPTIEQGKAIANAVNIASGRGSPGKFAGAMDALSVPFWSPRLALSRFQILAGAPLYRGDRHTRLLIAKEYAHFLIGLAGVYGIAKLAGSWMDDDKKPTIETDPRSSDFGKIRMGNTRVDPLGGLSQVTVLVSRLASGETKQLSGKLVPIRGDQVPYGGATGADVIARFLRSKLSPMLGTSIDLLSGKDVVGNPVTPASAAKEFFIPLSFQDIYASMKEQGVPAGAALGILSLFGMGVQNYEPRAAKSATKKP